MLPVFKDELVVDKGASIQVRPSLEALRRESQELEIQIKQLQDSVDALVRTQIRGIEGQLYNKANEIQEDISMKKFDVRAKQIHLAAVRAQVRVFFCCCCCFPLAFVSCFGVYSFQSKIAFCRFRNFFKTTANGQFSG
uniref:Uncharacterized protein n=1 Tax=Anopheles maculatus TaxID=74869 RepID=A0A182SN29_9DIPT